MYAMEEDALTLKLRSIFDTAPGWFQDWYFELRLSEEVYRAERYKSCLTVCLIRLKPSVNVDEGEGIRLLTTIGEQFRRTDFAGITKPNELALCLVNATRDQGMLVLGRISPLLSGHEVGHGFATFPGDSPSAEGLLRHARLRLEGVEGD
jgi:hypothetical protein